MAVIAVLMLAGCATLDDAAAVESALPTTKDMPGYSASGGVVSVLDAPKNAGMGKTVYSGDKLAAACARYRRSGDAWACEDLRGLGIAAYQDNENVESRVSSFVLGYRSSGAAKDAWRRAVAQQRKDLPKSKEAAEPAYGDESRTFTTPTGSIVLMRQASVLAIAMSHYDYGYRSDDSATADPIETWAEVQQQKIEQAL